MGSEMCIRDSLSDLPEFRQAKTIHVYWPHLAAREIDLRPLISYFRASGKTVVLPIVDFEAAAPRLCHGIFTSERELKANRWGFLEPHDNEMASATVIDAVIVPALGLDQRGYRIGYGGGYYDRFLSMISVASICPAFAACIVEHLPAEAHDVPVDVAVTEHEIIHHTTRVRPCP